MKRLFLFSGVAKRKEWWIVNIGWWLLMFAIAMLELHVFKNEEPGVLFIAVFLLSLWPMLATQIRRWHDRAKSGWWVLIGLIPIVGWIWVPIELGCFPSVKSDRYNP